MILWWRAAVVLILLSGWGPRLLPITRVASGWRAASWRKPVTVLVLPSGWRISTSVAVLPSTGWLTEWRPRSLKIVMDFAKSELCPLVIPPLVSDHGRIKHLQFTMWFVLQGERPVFGIVEKGSKPEGKVVLYFGYSYLLHPWPREMWCCF